MPVWLRGSKVALAVALLWSAVVAIALAYTLASIGHGSFDGLNNVTQIPFALPWFLIPIGTRNQTINAWEAAACGWLNAIIAFVWIARRSPAAAR